MDTNFFAFAASRLAQGDLAPALLAVCAAEQARAAQTFQPTDDESAACHALAAQLAACLGNHPEFCCDVLAAEGETWADLARHCRAPERLLRALNHATHGAADRSPVGGETLRAVRGEFAVSLDIASHTLRITHSGRCAAEFPCAVGLDFPADRESLSIRGKRIDAIHYDPAKVSAPERELPFTRYRLDCDGGICLHATPAWDATLFSKSVGLSREHAAILYAVTTTGHTLCLASHAPAPTEVNESEAAPSEAAPAECARCEESGCEGECTHEECDDPHCLSAQDASCESAQAAASENVAVEQSACSPACDPLSESPAALSETASIESSPVCDESSSCESACETTAEATESELVAGSESEPFAEAGESPAPEAATCETTAACDTTATCESACEPAACEAAACETATSEAPATSAPACEEAAGEAPACERAATASASAEECSEQVSTEANVAEPRAEQAGRFEEATARPAARRVTAWLENYLQTRAGKKEAVAASAAASTATAPTAAKPVAEPAPTATPSTLAAATSIAPAAAPVVPAAAPAVAAAPTPAAAAATPAPREDHGVFWTAPNGWQVTNLILSIAAMVTLAYVIGRQTAPPQTVQIPSPPPNVSLYPSFQPGQPVIVPAQVPNTPVSPANYAEAQRPQPQTPAPQPLEAPRADLKMDVYVPEGQVAVGDDAQYEIHLTNRGRLAAEEIDVQAFFSEGFEPVAAEGSLARINPGRVEFARIARIVPGQEVVLKIAARSAGEGERIFRPEVKCRNPEDFLHAEVATRFFFAPPGGVQRR